MSDYIKVLACANRIVRRIEEDLLDRRGLKWELRQCRPEVRERIRVAWREIIYEELRAGGLDRVSDLTS